MMRERAGRQSVFGECACGRGLLNLSRANPPSMLRSVKSDRRARGLEGVAVIISCASNMAWMPCVMLRRLSMEPGDLRPNFKRRTRLLRLEKFVTESDVKTWFGVDVTVCACVRVCMLKEGRKEGSDTCQRTDDVA